MKIESTYTDSLYVHYNLSDEDLIKKLFNKPEVLTDELPPYMFIGFPCLEPCKDVYPLNGKR